MAGRTTCKKNPAKKWNEDVYSSVLTRTKAWREPKCPSMDTWIKKMWYIYVCVCVCVCVCIYIYIYIYIYISHLLYPFIH